MLQWDWTLCSILDNHCIKLQHIVTMYITHSMSIHLLSMWSYLNLYRLGFFVQCCYITSMWGLLGLGWLDCHVQGRRSTDYLTTPNCLPLHLTRPTPYLDEVELEVAKWPRERRFHSKWQHEQVSLASLMEFESMLLCACLRPFTMPKTSFFYYSKLTELD